MRKFIQYTAILGAVLTVLGFGTAGAATINGARWSQMKVWKNEIRERKQRDYRIPPGTDTGQNIDASSKRFLCLPEFSIELDYGNLVVTTGEQEEILISCGSSSDFGETVWAYEDDGELKLVIYGRRKENRKPEVQVILPEQYFFQEADIEQISGTCSIEEIRAGEFSADVVAGELSINAITVDSLDLETAAGTITCMGGETARDADFDCAAGTIGYYGRIMGNIEAQCAAGNIHLELSQKEQDFNYELEGTGGSIQLGETSLSSIVFSKEIYHGAPRRMELESAAGNINVVFTTEEITVIEE